MSVTELAWQCLGPFPHKTPLDTAGSDISLSGSPLAVQRLRLAHAGPSPDRAPEAVHH